MKKIKFYCFFIAVTLLYSLNAAEPFVDFFKTSGVRVLAFDRNTKMSVSGNRIDMQMIKDSSTYQGVKLVPTKGKYFDFSKGSVFSFKVQNNSDVFTHLLVEIFNPKHDNSNIGGKAVYATIALKPREIAVFRTRYGRIIPEIQAWAPQGMQHSFDGFAGSRFNIYTDKVLEIRIWTHPVDQPRRIILSEFKLEEPPKPLHKALFSKDTFYPFIDQFGQYKWATWKNKIKSVEDLKKKTIEEDKFLATLPKISDRNKFGGWANGPTFDSKGGWSRVKYKGKWFLVDPAGKLFWSLGVNTIAYNNNEATGITYRENYFENLPAENSEYKICYTTRPFHAFRFYRGKNGPIKQFLFYLYNIMRKYGTDNFHMEFVKRSQRRLESWGFNTNGNWGEPDIIRAKSKLPYVVAVKFGPYYNVIEGCEMIGWQKLPDPFDPTFENGFKWFFDGEGKITAADPYCIGYFIDNELSWGKTGTFLAEGTIRSRAAQPAKQAMTKHFENKYGDIAKLNAVWGSSYQSWEDFLNTAADPVNPEKAKADMEEFNQIIVENYFKVRKEAINRYAPGKLYFGCRFNDRNVKVLKIAEKYLDALSFNCYAAQVAQLDIPKDIDTPIIIGEWHYGTANNGPGHGGLQVAANQKDRARACDRYIRSALEHPLIVGAHYFKYTDQPTTGRAPDDENIACGLVDIADTPYYDVVKAFRKVGEDMYKYRTRK